jgi:glycosyltransferase involved in cell wall biosynthesis
MEQLTATASCALEVSVVMPCLKEADTLATCIVKAQQALCENKLHGEVIVADNGSTDGSQAIATRLGARLVPVAARGYGHALMGGIAAAQGRFIIMGDADDSYDFLELPAFVKLTKPSQSISTFETLPAARPVSHGRSRAHTGAGHRGRALTSRRRL